MADDHDDPEFYRRLHVEFLSVIALTSIFCNFLVIFAIVRHRKLHREASNIVVVHINLLQAVYSIAALILTRYPFTAHHLVTLCSVQSMARLLLAAIEGLLIVSLWQWYLQLFVEEEYRKCFAAYKFLVVMIYAFFAWSCALNVHYCVYTHSSYGGTKTFFSCGLLLAGLAALCDLQYVFRKGKSGVVNVGLAVANVFVACWAPSFFLQVVELLIDCKPSWLLVRTVSLLGHSSGIVCACYLFCCVDSYRGIVKSVVQCRWKDDEEQNTKDQERLMSSNTQNSIHV